MYPDEFDYHEATSVGEAIDLMAEHAGEEVELLAGGHSLIPAMKSGLSSPDVLIDVGGIDDLHGVRVHKYRAGRDEMLLAYEDTPDALILLALGTHENYYRDLKKYRKG